MALNELVVYAAAVVVATCTSRVIVLDSQSIAGVQSMSMLMGGWMWPLESVTSYCWSEVVCVCVCVWF